MDQFRVQENNPPQQEVEEIVITQPQSELVVKTPEPVLQEQTEQMEYTDSILDSTLELQEETVFSQEMEILQPLYASSEQVSFSSSEFGIQTQASTPKAETSIHEWHWEKDAKGNWKYVTQEDSQQEQNSNIEIIPFSTQKSSHSGHHSQSSSSQHSGKHNHRQDGEIDYQHGSYQSSGFEMGIFIVLGVVFKVLLIFICFKLIVNCCKRRRERREKKRRESQQMVAQYPTQNHPQNQFPQQQPMNNWNTRQNQFIQQQPIMNQFQHFGQQNTVQPVQATPSLQAPYQPQQHSVNQVQPQQQQQFELQHYNHNQQNFRQPQQQQQVYFQNPNNSNQVLIPIPTNQGQGMNYQQQIPNQQNFRYNHNNGQIMGQPMYH